MLMARRADVTASTSPLLRIGVLATAAPRASMLGKTMPTGARSASAAQNNEMMGKR